MKKGRLLFFAALSCLMLTPVVLAGFSPYLAFRDIDYIIAGFAGIVCLSLLVLQPVLATKDLPMHPRRMRILHRWIGAAIAIGVVIHVGGLYITSPPDAIDAFLFRAPTWFSTFGVLAMWLTLAALMLAITRKRNPKRWKIMHRACATAVAVLTIFHALLIEGAMETVSKWLVCCAIALSLVWPLVRKRV